MTTGAQETEPNPQPARTRWWDGPWIDRAGAQTAFDAQFGRDALGHRVHTAFALLAVFMVPFHNSLAEIAAFALGVYALVRVFHTRRQWVHWFGQPAMLAWLAVAGWTAISLAWTPDRTRGLDELDSLRWLLFGWALWPVIDRRRWLIIALGLGFVVGHGAQLVQFLAIEFGWSGFDFDRFPDRVSGWWDPAVAGSLLVGALGLHLPAVVWGHGRARCLGLAGASLALVGLVATGSRGGWIAAAALVGLVAVAGLWTWFRQDRKTVRARGWFGVIGAGLLVVGLGAATWATLGDRVLDRIEQASSEVRASVESGESESSTGLRIAMIEGAVDAAVAHPIKGVGAGGFGPWAREHTTPAAHDHAHNQLLHAAATQGAIGTVLLVLAGVLSLRGAAVRARHRVSVYEIGPAWALIGLGLVSAFDTLLVNSQTAALTGVLIGLSPVFVPQRTSDYSGASEQSR